MRVLALMKYGAEAASTRQRLLQYLPYLAAQGITVEMRPLLGDDHVRRLARGERSGVAAIAAAYASRLLVLVNSRRFDLIWVHCELLPYMPGMMERLVGLWRKPVVLDYDDAIFHMYDAHPNAVVRSVLGRKFRTVVRAADAVLPGNAYLAEYARTLTDAVTIVPTVVDTDMYVPTPTRDAALTVGWIGSPSTWRYVDPILPAILPTIERHGGSFLAVGGGVEADRHPGIVSRPWSEAREIADVQSMDIGIMPLPDEQWARGKCGYKLIQYMACGKPVVASPVGVNAEIVSDGDDGLIAVTPDDWASAIGRLMEQPAWCRAMGRQGRAKVVERYSLASQAPRVAAVLTGLAGSSR